VERACKRWYLKVLQQEIKTQPELGVNYEKKLLVLKI